LSVTKARKKLVDKTRITIPGEETAFKALFTEHYKGMYSYACIILKDETEAEEIVQNVFVRLWEKQKSIQIETSLKAYLYRMVYNDCMNHIKHKAVVLKFQKEKTYAMKNESDNAEEKIASTQLNEQLSNALRELPEQCRTIFQLSRFEELKYREIAGQLGISEKTVENQMGKALRILRMKLVDFLPLIILLTVIMKKI
jgi:RNA polymerase sigma-70 factor (ECF subfamily)